MIFLIISVRGDSPVEAPSTCTPILNATRGGRAEISYSFIGDFKNSDILVYKGERQVKIIDCYLQDGERLCERKPGFNFFLLTNNKERTDCVLVIERVTKQTADVYVFQTLDPQQRCKPYTLQAEEPEVYTQPAFPEGDRSPDKESPNQTGSNQTFTLSPGTVAGIVVGALIGFAVAVAVVVVKMRKQICCKKRGLARYTSSTIEGGVTSSEKGAQTLFILSPKEGDDTSSDSSQGSTTPLVQDTTPSVYNFNAGLGTTACSPHYQC